MIGKRLGIGGSRRSSSASLLKGAFLKFLLFANQKYTHVITASKSDNMLVDEEINVGTDKRNNISILHCTFMVLNVKFKGEFTKKCPLLGEQRVLAGWYKRCLKNGDGVGSYIDLICIS